VRAAGIDYLSAGPIVDKVLDDLAKELESRDIYRGDN